MSNTIHHGRNVKRFREMLGIKQESLALSMGEDWNQKKISLLESKEVIDDALLEQVAGIFKVPAVAIKNFDEERAVYNIQNNYENSNNRGGVGVDTQNIECTFHNDKLVEALEEIKSLHIALLKEKDEKIALLEKMLEMKK
ncbi:XRE family transcriptional regulator [Ferruginibacter sp. SUN106]|uniref:XRE family transcriptional regulator n=1 Tax=Ferruginibacter sp. SUN106 TaxID=2978348 RepID=UPI003D36E1A0